MMTEIALGLAAASCIVGTFALIMAVIAFIELRSFNKSTHQIQYMPVDDAMSESELNKVLDQEMENLERDLL